MLSHCPAMAGQRMNARSASSSGGQRLGRSPSRSITQPVSLQIIERRLGNERRQVEKNGRSNHRGRQSDARMRPLRQKRNKGDEADRQCELEQRYEAGAGLPGRRVTSASPAMTPIEPRTMSQPVPARNPAMTGNGYEADEAAEPEVAHEIEGNAGKHARNADRRNNCHQDLMFAGADREPLGHRRCDDGQRSERHLLGSADHSRHARAQCDHRRHDRAGEKRDADACRQVNIERTGEDKGRLGGGCDDDDDAAQHARHEAGKQIAGGEQPSRRLNDQIRHARDIGMAPNDRPPARKRPWKSALFRAP